MVPVRMPSGGMACGFGSMEGVDVAIETTKARCEEKARRREREQQVKL